MEGSGSRTGLRKRQRVIEKKKIEPSFETKKTKKSNQEILPCVFDGLLSLCKSKYADELLQEINKALSMRSLTKIAKKFKINTISASAFSRWQTILPLVIFEKVFEMLGLTECPAVARICRNWRNISSKSVWSNFHVKLLPHNVNNVNLNLLGNRINKLRVIDLLGENQSVEIVGAKQLRQCTRLYDLSINVNHCLNWSINDIMSSSLTSTLKNFHFKNGDDERLIFEDEVKGWHSFSKLESLRVDKITIRDIDLLRQLPHITSLRARDVSVIKTPNSSVVNNNIRNLLLPSTLKYFRCEYLYEDVRLGMTHEWKSLTHFRADVSHSDSQEVVCLAKAPVLQHVHYQIYATVEFQDLRKLLDRPSIQYINLNCHSMTGYAPEEEVEETKKTLKLTIHEIDQEYVTREHPESMLDNFIGWLPELVHLSICESGDKYYLHDLNSAVRLESLHLELQSRNRVPAMNQTIYADILQYLPQLLHLCIEDVSLPGNEIKPILKMTKLQTLTLSHCDKLDPVIMTEFITGLHHVNPASNTKSNSKASFVSQTQSQLKSQSQSESQSQCHQFWVESYPSKYKCKIKYNHTCYVGEFPSLQINFNQCKVQGDDIHTFCGHVMP